MAANLPRTSRHALAFGFLTLGVFPLWLPSTRTRQSCWMPRLL